MIKKSIEEFIEENGIDLTYSSEEELADDEPAEVLLYEIE